MTSKKKSYHAVYYIATGKTEILRDKTKYTEIYSAGGTRYKSFETEDEAIVWLNSVKEEYNTNSNSKGLNAKQKQRKKYYAVYVVDTKQSYILDTWAETLQLRNANKGNCVYKGFQTKEDAQAYINTLSPEYIERFLYKSTHFREINKADKPDNSKVTVENTNFEPSESPFY